MVLMVPDSTVSTDKSFAVLAIQLHFLISVYQACVFFFLMCDFTKVLRKLTEKTTFVIGIARIPGVHESTEVALELLASEAILHHSLLILLTVITDGC